MLLNEVAIFFLYLANYMGVCLCEVPRLKIFQRNSFQLSIWRNLHQLNINALSGIYFESIFSQFMLVGSLL